jgi:hypothetical protein
MLVLEFNYYLYRAKKLDRDCTGNPSFLVVMRNSEVEWRKGAYGKGELVPTYMPPGMSPFFWYLPNKLVAPISHSARD